MSAFKSNKRKEAEVDAAGAGERRRKAEDGSNINPANGEEMECAEEGDGLVFEDPFGDEFEEEEVEETYDENDVDEPSQEEAEYLASVANGGSGIEAKSNEPKTQLWRPGIDQIGENEELEYDPSAYIMYHSLQTEWPCLSFDFLKDDLGDNRQRFPMSMYMVSGSQADRGDRNKITLLKMSDLHRTQANPDSDNEDDDDENIDEDPTLEHVSTPHQGGINRIRSMPQNPGVVATMADTRQVHVFDMSASFRSMMAAGPRVNGPTKPIFTFKGHREEGYAIDWSHVTTGRLATGDCSGLIHIWNASGSGGGSVSSWQVDTNPYRGHGGSVEDLQWSPSEGTVFSSGSTDKTVRIWDTRGKQGPQITINAHDDDVNVISWNSKVSYLLASGCEDGSFKVWDLRSIRNKAEPLAHFKYHKASVTSIEWAPHDESVVCLSSSDNQVTIWDLSVEADDEALLGPDADPHLNDYPPQLLFIHQGQSNVKEVHHHPQIPGVIMTTAEDGFNVFKPAITVS